MPYLISLIFLISGATGLVYEVIWAKHLALLLGSTAYAHTIVLATFLAGLALGNAVLGPTADHSKRPLLMYGWLELGIAVLAALSPFFFEYLSGFYIGLAREFSIEPLIFLLLRIALCAVVLLLPTFLMGGTLPYLTRFATRSLKQMEASVSWLYFLNSFGAVIGALIAGFYLVPSFGLNLSITFTAAVNLVIGAIALYLGKFRWDFSLNIFQKERDEKLMVPLNRYQILLLFFAIFVSGVISLSYEIAWIRLLSLVLGSSTYSFSLMLSAFIAGIAFGSFLISARLFSKIHSFALFGLAEICIAISVIITLPFYDRLPYYFLVLKSALQPTPAGFYVFEVMKFVFCFFLMVIPTLFIGMTLPLASRAATASIETIGKKVGSVFSINTIGNVVGASITGLLLLPVLGIQGVIEVGIFVNLLLGFLIILSFSGWSSRVRIYVLLVSLILPYVYFMSGGSLDKKMLTTGTFRLSLPEEVKNYADFQKWFSHKRLLYYKDDKDSTVSVEKSKDFLVMKVNGKPDASSGRDMPTQKLLAHIPMIYNPDAKSLLLIGYGSGVTAGSALRHPIENLDVIEISEAVIDASDYFNEFNYDALNDNRVNLHIEDAKTFLQLTKQTYDVVISEPSNPWIAGIGNLFSAEFYRDIKEHLNPGGVIAQWFHSYEMDDETLRLIIRTFSNEFSNVSLWNTLSNKNYQGDYMLIGYNSKQTGQLDFNKLTTWFENPGLREDLAGIQINTLPTLLSLQISSNETVTKFTGEGPVNEDMYPVLEYQAPRAFFLRAVASIVEDMDERFNTTPIQDTLFHNYLEHREESLSSNEMRNIVNYHFQRGAPRFAEASVRAWNARYPDNPETAWNLVQLLILNKKHDEALFLLNDLAKAQPDNREISNVRSQLLNKKLAKLKSYLIE